MYLSNRMCHKESASAFFMPRVEGAHTPQSELSVSPPHPSVCVILGWCESLNVRLLQSLPALSP